MNDSTKKKQDEATSAALANCPFCGGEPAYNTTTYSENHVREQGWDQSIFHGVNCIECGVNNRGIIGWSTKEDALEAWNRRVTTCSSGAGPLLPRPLQYGDMNSSVFLQNVHHAYAQTDGAYAWPNTRDGDMLRQAQMEIKRLRMLLASYRDETPPRHQPHMITRLIDEALGRVPNVQIEGLAATRPNEGEKA